MTTEDALLAAIWAEPHDDTPRLVYADWLQENDQSPRAEFIRVQCRLADLDADSTERAALERRERLLARKYRAAWNDGLPKLLTRARFVRGFVYPRMRGLRASQFLALTPADLAPAPLWSFRIESGTKLWAHVADSPSLRRIDHLDFGNNLLDEPAAVRLLSSEHLVNVSNLGLGLSRFTRPALSALAANDALAHLRQLDFWSNQMSDDVIAPLVGSPRLANVRTLNLSSNPVTGATIRALAGSPHTSGLRHLDLTATHLGDDGVRALAQSPLRLEVLVLSASRMTESSVEDLAAWVGLRTVRVLTLGPARFGLATARAFAGSPHFRDDVVISFWHTGIQTDKVAVALLRDRFGKRVQFW